MHTCTLIILIDFNFYKNSKKINIFKKIVHSQILNNRNIKINTNKINITWMISFWSKIKFSFMLFYFIHIIQHSKCWLFFFFNMIKLLQTFLFFFQIYTLLFYLFNASIINRVVDEILSLLYYFERIKPDWSKRFFHRYISVYFEHENSSWKPRHSQE